MSCLSVAKNGGFVKETQITKNVVVTSVCNCLSSSSLLSSTSSSIGESEDEMNVPIALGAFRDNIGE